MYSPKRIKITDVNPHLICVLCGGYYIDATTVIECLHSFCKSCIVKYLEKNKYCPICDVQIHKTTPLLNIRPDTTLQNIVYKLVPSLFKNEMQRRVEFYQKHPGPLPPLPEQRGEITESTPILFPDEQLIICLELHGAQPSQQVHQRYLHCPTSLSIGHLVKLVRGKYDLNNKHQVQIFYKDDILMEHITLMDVAYTYQCRRKVPIHLSYKILELKVKRIRIINREPKEEKPEVKEWKEVQLQISENGVMSVRNVESCECSPIPAFEAPPVYSPSSIASSTANHTQCSSAISPTGSSSPQTQASGQSSVVPEVDMADTSVQTKPITSLPDPVKPEVSNSALKPPVTSSASTVTDSQSSISSNLISTFSTSNSMISSNSVSIPVSSTIVTSSSCSTAQPVASLTSPVSQTFQTVTSSIACSSVALPSLSNSITSPIFSSTIAPSISPKIHPGEKFVVSSPSSPVMSIIPSRTIVPSPLVSTSSVMSAMISHPISATYPSSTIPVSILANQPSSTFSSIASKSLSFPSTVHTPSLSHHISHPSITSSTVGVPTLPVHSMPLPMGCYQSSTSPSIPPPFVGSTAQSLAPGGDSGMMSTMAGMKSSTQLVPSSFPITSATRPQTEPIVSVSKVSKDQVRKPNNVIEVNKLSISRVPPGGMKEKGENLNKIVNKLSPNERVIGNTSVTIRPVANSPTSIPPKMYPISRMLSPSHPTSTGKERPPQIRYKTLKSPTKQWNPSIDRATQMQIMKQNADQSKPPRIFKMRNMPRFLGNPASGVKPLYACPEEPAGNQTKQKSTLMKVDLKSIPTSSIPRSPTKQPPPYTPGSPKLNKPPPAYPDPKAPYLSPRMPSPAHAGSYLPPNPYHLLYSGYPGFSHEANRMLSPELIRSMCAYHPSLPPSISMMFNPSMHPALPRPQENYKPDPATPSVQRIPPSKSETPPPKPSDDKRYPSPVSTSDVKKLTPTPPPISPKDVDKPPPTPPATPQESKPNPTVEVPPSPSIVKENHLEITPSEQSPLVDSNSVKSNCDVNITNNNSKESPSSQSSDVISKPE